MQHVAASAAARLLSATASMVFTVCPCTALFNHQQSLRAQAANAAWTFSVNVQAREAAEAEECRAIMEGYVYTVSNVTMYLY
jgi:hypothetical protein